MNNIQELKFKGTKDMVSTYKLCIIDKIYKQSFLYKPKYTSGILDVVIFNLDYFSTSSFCGTKWLVV